MSSIDERIWTWVKVHTHSGTRYPLLIKRLQAVLPHAAIPEVLDVLTEVCPECWDSDRSCQCWNDD